MDEFREEREEKELKEFSWSNFFLVTGCCFLIFAGVMKLIEGSVHPIFLRIGIICLSLRVLSFIYKWLSKKFPSRRETTRHREFH